MGFLRKSSKMLSGILGSSVRRCEKCNARIRQGNVCPDCGHKNWY